MSEKHSMPLVLVVDDYDDGRELYLEYLAFFGYRVAAAANGQEALARTFALGPDLILMDLSLPVMDGWEATRQLKQDPRSKHIVIVAITGHAHAGAAERARQAGCDAFLLKPCSPEQVLDEVRRWVGPAAERREPRTKGKSRGPKR